MDHGNFPQGSLRRKGAMRRMRRGAVLLGAVLAIAAVQSGCEGRTPSRCQRTCAREAECAEQLGRKVDRLECLEYCSALDRAQAGAAAVERHIACVDEAPSCELALACE